MLSRARAVGRRGPNLFAIVLIAVLAAACGGLASAPAGQGGNPVPGAGAGAGEQPDPQAAGGGNTDNGGGKVVYAAGQPDLLIIKTGSLILQVTGIDAALAGATQQIAALGGYASGSQRSGDDESDQATVTFRIPAARWDEALKGLRALGTKVLAEESATDDVTSQVIDLGARIKNLQATEQALQGIMARATEIKDVLAVQAELTSVRGEIEQLTAQKTHLEEQAAFSTLSVTFSLKPDPVLSSQSQFDPKSEVDRAAASLVNVLQGLATAGIWFAIVWLPILLVLVVIVGVVLVIARRITRSGTGSGTGSATAAEAPVEPTA